MNITKQIIIAIIAISFIIGIVLYPTAPNQIASHWNINGSVDGYMSKFWGLFLMPILSLVMFLLFLFLPKIDPLKENIKKFREHFDRFILALVIFLFYIYLLTIFWMKGIRFDMGQFIAPMMGIFFYYTGIVLEKVKMNWFIGIRTPWTMSSHSVWDKTHQLASKLFKVSGVIAYFGLLFPAYAFALVLIPVILSSIYVVVYSYLEYRREHN